MMNMVKLIWYIVKHSSNNEVAWSWILIEAQVDKFVTGMDVIKKDNFSDYVKKNVSHQKCEM